MRTGDARTPQRVKPSAASQAIGCESSHRLRVKPSAASQAIGRLGGWRTAIPITYSASSPAPVRRRSRPHGVASLGNTTLTSSVPTRPRREPPPAGWPRSTPRTKHSGTDGALDVPPRDLAQRSRPMPVRLGAEAGDRPDRSRLGRSPDGSTRPTPSGSATARRHPRAPEALIPRVSRHSGRCRGIGRRRVHLIRPARRGGGDCAAFGRLHSRHWTPRARSTSTLASSGATRLARLPRSSPRTSIGSRRRSRGTHRWSRRLGLSVMTWTAGGSYGAGA
jgi:hypothetical protein